ncbi:MAG: LysR family transcriptional regulator [Delftia acidovorans]|uniref:LysR family transcriptional regulator n=1 Tax=Delftia sp. UME58 TaxID=1862322 RepID=UPI00160008A7|nr:MULTISPECIES: LysR family transcriptional regulator [Delftia]MBB1652441.1 hypothetical protein [Delftia sp. UME58]MBL8357495.1 LysR family transcriptional regulator [Delftia acidovorans]
MDFRQLRQFLVLSETRSFSVAAQKLHLGQPALSTSIRKLEEEFGCQLFLRTSRGVDLTMAGQAAMADLRKALLHVQQARDNARLAAAGKSGTLKIGFVGSVVSTLMPKLLAGFCAQHPQVRLELEEATTSLLIERVRRGDVDVGLVRFPIDNDPDLVVSHIQDDHLLVALPRHHVLAALDEIPLVEMTYYPFIHYTGEVQGALAPVIDALFQEEGLAPNTTHRAAQVQTVLGLVEEGIGLAMVPSNMSAISMRLSPHVVLRPIAGGKSARISLGLIHLAQPGTPARIHFCEAVMAFRQGGLMHLPDQIGLGI